MAKKEKEQEPVTHKEFDKTTKELEELDGRMKTQIENLYLYIGKKVEQIEAKMATVESRSNSNQLLIKEHAKAEAILTKDIAALKKELVTVKKQISINKQQIETQVNTQEEIIMDMIKKFYEQLLSDKNNLNSQIEEIRNQQDVLKISFTVNEKKLLEKIKDEVNDDIRNAVKGKEYEVLMKYWIQDLKNILADFEKLKKMHPKEFNLQLNEISNTIQVFRQRLSI